MSSDLKPPEIFVAPNGARKGKNDHPALPISIGEIVETAKNCFAVGATGIHAHVRDREGRHVLDGGLYKELLAELAKKVPAIKVQITTESIGQYSPLEQRNLVMAVKPKMVSVSMAEMFEDDDLAAVSRFYYAAKEQGTEVQHIVYSGEEFSRLTKLIMLGTIPAKQRSVLFVLGRYSKNQQSSPDMLNGFIEILAQQRLSNIWQFMTCAFGQGETDCLLASARMRGDCRVGFENNFLHSDGRVAQDNAARVSALLSALKLQNLLT